MKIAVCVCTPTGGAVNDRDAFERRGRVGRAVLSPFDSRAVEMATRIAEAHGGEVVVLSVGSAADLGAVREALALGGERGVILDDPMLDGSDLIGIARALAALFRSEAPTMMLGCFWNGDIDGSLLWAATAELLGVPMIAQAQALEFADGEVIARRQIETGDLTVAAATPCLVDLAETIVKPRYPTIKTKMAAKRKPVCIVSLAEIGLAADAVGKGAAAAVLGALREPPASRQPRVVEGAAATPEAVHDFLAEKGLLP